MVRSVGELPFREWDARELLNLTDERASPVLDDIRFGWCRLDRVWLESPAGLTVVESPLVIALHAAEDGEALDRDVELEFYLDDEHSVTALLSTFLGHWLPRLPAASRLVLAMCNPHRATLPHPGGVPVHYAHGDVDSWLEHGDDSVRLAADSWHLAE